MCHSWDESPAEVRPLGSPYEGKKNSASPIQTFDTTRSVAPALGAEEIRGRSRSAYRDGVWYSRPSATIKADGGVATRSSDGQDGRATGGNYGNPGSSCCGVTGTLGAKSTR